MAVISPAPTGAIWAGWPASPIRSPRVAGTATSLLGSKSSTPNTAWPAAAPRWSRPPRGFQSTYHLLSLTRYRLWHLLPLDEPAAHCAALLPARLEHRRSVDRQGSAFPPHAAGPSPCHLAAR